MLIGVSGPRQNWPEIRAFGVTIVRDLQTKADPDRKVTCVKIVFGTDLAVTADRAAAHLNARPETDAFTECDRPTRRAS